MVSEEVMSHGAFGFSGPVARWDGGQGGGGNYGAALCVCLQTGFVYRVVPAWSSSYFCLLCSLNSEPRLFLQRGLLNLTI